MSIRERVKSLPSAHAFARVRPLTQHGWMRGPKRRVRPRGHGGRAYVNERPTLTPGLHLKLTL